MKALCFAVAMLMCGAGAAMADAASDLQRAFDAESAGDHAGAIGQFTKLLKSGAYSQDVVAHIYVGRGVAHTNQAEFQEAIDDFTQAVEIDPTLAEAYYDRARVYSDVGSYTQSLADFAQLESVADKLPKYYVYRGYVHYENKDYAEAEADLTRALKDDPKSVEAYFHRARTYADQDKRQQASDDFTKVIELASDDDSMKISAYRWRGLESFLARRYDAAIADFTALLDMDASDADARTRRARVYMAAGDYEKAFADADMLARADGTQLAPWPGVYESQKPFADRIVEQYNAAMGGPGVDPYAYVLRARAALQLGRKDEALADYEKAIALIPPGGDPSVPAEMEEARAWTPLKGFMARNPTLVIVSGILVLALGAGGGFFWWRKRKAHAPAGPAPSSL